MTSTDEGGTTLSESPSEHLTEEPQEERGDPGSRDTGSDEPDGGPVERPAGKSDEKDDSAIDPQPPVHEDSPHLPTGD